MRLERFMPDTEQATRSLVVRTFDLAARWAIPQHDFYELVLIGDLEKLGSADPDPLRTRVTFGWSEIRLQVRNA